MNQAQQKIINKVLSYCPTAKVQEQEPCLFVNWTNNEEHILTRIDYMAVVGKRGGFKILSASRVLTSDKKHEKVLAKLALYDLKIRGTVKFF